jgi:hypothetical protein
MAKNILPENERIAYELIGTAIGYPIGIGIVAAALFYAVPFFGLSLTWIQAILLSLGFNILTRLISR